MEEVWKECEFDKRYKISNMGNVMSFTRGEKLLKCSILNKNKNHDCQYKYIQILKDGKRKNYLIHRLVAIAFIPNDNDDYTCVDHIDRNTFNNNVNNLRWCNHTINMRNTAHYRTDITELDFRKRDNILSAGYRQKTKDSKRFYCETCDFATSSQFKLDRHLNGPRCKKKCNNLGNP